LNDYDAADNEDGMEEMSKEEGTRNKEQGRKLGYIMT
jgi:hypothetical protein